MPWHLDSNHPGCSGWAVVLDATGKAVGCHPTKAKALAQLAALNANVKEAGMTQATRAAVDNSAWDGNAAMNVCTTAADYNKVCAGKTDGDPALRSSHKLPHHYLAKAPVPNADGVRAALQRFSATQGLTNREEARRHLEAHMGTIQAQEASAMPTADLYRALTPGAAHFELREDSSDGPPTLVGHFSRFNEWTEIDSWFEGRFMEQVERGAFLDSFKERTPKVTFNHGRDPELGDKLLGHPVTVREDDIGGAYETPMFKGVPDLLVDGLRAGAYGSSFRFSVDEERIVERPERSDYNPEGLPERTIVRASVFEAGPVTFPAYANATAGVRSLTDEFRPAAETVAELAAKRPGELARMIEEVLHKGAEDKPPEDKPLPTPVVRRFRTREEWLQWMST